MYLLHMVNAHNPIVAIYMYMYSCSQVCWTIPSSRGLTNRCREGRRHRRSFMILQYYVFLYKEGKVI